MLQYIPQILIICLLPAIFKRFVSGTKVGNILSPVVLAYTVGILLTMVDFIPLDPGISINFSQVSIMIAIPLLLFSADIKGWLSHAKATVLSFVLAIVAALVSTVLFAFLYNNQISEVWNHSGMLLGVFTGGTANMQAVGIGLGVENEAFALLNTVEIIWGGILLIFLTSIAHRIYGLFLPDYEYGTNKEKEIVGGDERQWKDIMIAIGLSILIAGTTVGLTFLIFGGMNEKNLSFTILVLTALSVAASFYGPIRRLRGSFEAGDYLILVFCVAIGMRSDFSEMMNSGGSLFLFTGGCMMLTVGLHLFLSWIFKIDRDTTIITSTASIYGPAFIGQLASAIKNKEIVFAGMATGLVGYAVGNVLGIGVGRILMQILS